MDILKWTSKSYEIKFPFNARGLFTRLYEIFIQLFNISCKFYYICIMNSRKFIFHLIGFFLLLSVVACRNASVQTVGVGKWTLIDREFDSVAALLETSFCRFESDSARSVLLEDLRDIVSRKNIDIMRGRLMYWQAKMQIKGNKFLNAENSLLRAKHYIDSAAYPYDIMRVNYEMAVISDPDIVNDYRRDMKLLEYFESIRDSLMIASLHINLGGTFRLAGDTVSALHHINEAGKIFKGAGLSDLALMNNMNSAILSGDASADKLLDPLRHNRNVRSIESLYLSVIYNSYLVSHDPSYLYQLHDMLKGKEAHRAGYAHICGLLSSHIFEENGDRDSIYMYAMKAKEALDNDDPLSTRGAVLYSLVNAYETNGQLDSAMKYIKLFQDNSSKIMYGRSAEKINAFKSRVGIEKFKEEEDRMRKAERQRYITIALVILVGSVVIFILLFSRIRNIRLRHELAKSELEKVRYQLAASALVRDGNNRAIEEISDVVKKMTCDGRLKRNEASEIVSLINVTKSDSEDRQAFEKIYETLRPDFVSSLKLDYPDLSEGQLRMAAYITLGMTNREIASLMGVRQQSVVKNRYRMRLKMKLPHSVSLEEALRKYS